MAYVEGSGQLCAKRQRLIIYYLSVGCVYLLRCYDIALLVVCHRCALPYHWLVVCSLLWLYRGAYGSWANRVSEERCVILYVFC